MTAIGPRMSRPCHRASRSPKSGQSSSAAVASSSPTKRSSGTKASSWCSTPGRDVEARQQRAGSAAQLADQVDVAPQVRWPGSGCPCSATSVSGNDKSMSDRCQYPRWPCSSPALECMTTQHFDVLIIGAGLSGIGTACQSPASSRTRPSRCWSAASGWAAPGTCSATRASAPTPTCSRSATSSGRGTTPRCSRDGASIRQYIADTAAGVRHRREDPLRRSRSSPPTGPAPRASGPSPPLHEATGETAHLHLRLPDQLHRLLQLRRRLPARRSRAPSASRARPSTRSTGRRTSTTPARRSS